MITIPTAVIGAATKVVPVLKNHWGKILSGIFIVLIVWYIWKLQDDLEEANQSLGAFDGALQICEQGKVAIQDSLDILNDELRLLVEDNEAKKLSIIEAENRIIGLKTEGEKRVAEIENQVIPESCDGAMDWLLQNAIIFGENFDEN